MQKSPKRWGIDLTGRKMCYAPWPIDVNDNYRQPNNKEKEEIYERHLEWVKLPIPNKQNIF